jgi:hypothetical protein
MRSRGSSSCSAMSGPPVATACRSSGSMPGSSRAACAATRALRHESVPIVSRSRDGPRE